MSRINYDDNDSEYAALDAGRWEANRRRVWTSKRGQRALRELLAALEALPEQRLTESQLCEPEYLGDGPVIVERANVCVLGALALGKDWTVAELAAHSADLCGDYDTAQWAAERLGMRWMLAWQLMEANDEDFGDCTPEERYARMLALVRSAVREEVPDATP